MFLRNWLTSSSRSVYYIAERRSLDSKFSLHYSMQDNQAIQVRKCICDTVRPLASTSALVRPNILRKIVQLHFSSVFPHSKQRRQDDPEKRRNSRKSMYSKKSVTVSLSPTRASFRRRTGAKRDVTHLSLPQFCLVHVDHVTAQ
jgi:hypothetical protein